MKWLFAAFKTLKRVMSGEVVAQIDSQANGGFTTISLRLKKDSTSGEYYVVLAELTTGNSQYVVFTKDEFGQFSDTVSALRKLLREHSAEAKK